MLRRMVKIGLGSLLGALLVAQLFQPERSNPPYVAESSFEAVAQPTARVSTIVKRACHDCHSNETVWPFYSRIAPASWLIAQDVREGRSHLNFSEWDRLGPEMANSRLGEMCEQARSREMPPAYYLPLHPSARLNQNDIGALCGELRSDAGWGGK